MAPLGKRMRVRLYDRLVARGVLRAEQGRILGVFPSHRWPTEDAAHEASLREDLAAALRQGVTTEARTDALISLLHALKVVHKVVDPAAVGLSRAEMAARAKRIAEGDWAGAAVRAAIDSMNAAISAAVSTAVIAAGSGA